jgi:Contractile injection system tube protein
MPSFPGSPRLFKGALIGVDPTTNIAAALLSANVIIFQYNPETMTRQVEARSLSWEEGSSRYEPFRLIGPPKETITLDVEIDATDQLEKGNSDAKLMGIHPILAALELLLYSSKDTVISNQVLEKGGSMELTPPEGPLIFFVWGKKRVLPVRLSSFTINEQAYDPHLNPIRASVNLSLQVLSYYDLEADSPGAKVFLIHQGFKEGMAKTNIFNSISDIGFSLTNFLTDLS